MEILQNFSLLLVEDDLQTQEQMEMILSEYTDTLYQALNGEEGLEIYKKYAPDIIITDIQMPLRDGLSMAKEIKKDNPHAPIVVISAFDDRKVLLEAIDIGIDSFVQKPVDIDKLLQKLQQIAYNLYNEREVQKARQKELEILTNLAHYDSLTQIPNRYYFNLKLEEMLSHSIETKQTFALFFIDLDSFKNINDTYGHAAGDALLSHVANNIRSVIRKEDIFARISGDEFAVITDNISSVDEIEAFAQKILRAVEQPLDIAGKSVSISCSIGVSRYPQDGSIKEYLLQQADMRMYEAKKNGKGRVSLTA